MDIETIRGKMDAEVWHSGRHVAANPSGFNWRIDGDEVEQTLKALTDLTPLILTGYRMRIDIYHVEDVTFIEAQDTGLPAARTMTAITVKGRAQFIEVLQEAMTRPEGFRKQIEEYELMHPRTPPRRKFLGLF